MILQGKPVTVSYVITNEEEFRKTNLFGIEHHGMKSDGYSVGNCISRAWDFEDALLQIAAGTLQPAAVAGKMLLKHGRLPKQLQEKNTNKKENV